jgi:succinylglutamic semialdehyde dehydrogenase
MKNYINGAWVAAEGERYWESRSPADRGVVLGSFVEDEGAPDAAMEAAKRAQPGWEALGIEGRGAALGAFARALTARQGEIARAIALEVGKPLWEADGEAAALASKIKVTLDQSMAEVAGKNQVSGGSWVDGGYRYRPLGVCVVPGPFNFPLHLANGHIQAALATGNAVVFKPSELAPRCGEVFMEAAHAAGLPPGVLNMVQGGPEAGKRLVAHRDTGAVLFTGSLRAGIAIRRQTVEEPWKLLALEMGGKNSALVLEDADLDRAAYEIAQGALLTCGQRCTGTSRVVVMESALEGLKARLVKIWDRVQIGHPLDDAAFMGPLINEAARGRFLDAARTARAEGMEAIRENAAYEAPRPGGGFYEGYYVRPALWQATQAPRAEDLHAGEEIFGPDVVLFVVRDGDEEAMIEAANATHYGLAMSVFTRDAARFERMAARLEAGVLNFNRSTVGAVATMPFGGVKGSGNHRPAALVATRNCVYPVATLRNPDALAPGEVMARFPGDVLGG